MIEIVKQPGEYCFVGNPVLFRLKSDSQDPVEIEIAYQANKIALKGYPYKTEEGYLVDIDISDVLKSFFDNGLAMYGETIGIAEYPEFIRECTVTIDAKDYIIKAIDGGVSNENLAELLGFGDDMFSYRLKNPERSLLFTTRTNSPNIALRESELFPFVFLHPGKPITFVSSNDNTITESSLPEGTPCLMDLAYIRRLFLELYDELPAFITVQVDGADSSYITITRSRWSEDMCWLVFKNSLGGYECMEITGKGYYIPALSEENSYQQYTDLGTFSLRRERVEVQNVISIHAGFKNQQELNFLMDLIATNRCYLIYPDKRVMECIPSAENPKYAMRITEPTSLELKLKSVNSSRYHSPLIDLARPGAWIWDGIWDDYAYWYDSKQINDYK